MNVAKKFCKILMFAVRCVVWLLFALVVVYAFGAVVFDGPFGAASIGNWVLALGWLVAVIVTVAKLRGRSRWIGLAALLLVVFLPWSFVKPSNDKVWQAEFAQTGRTVIDGDVVTFYNFRDFRYDGDGQPEERWVTRVVHLSNLRGVDLFLDAFGGETLAHPISSFDFGPDGHVCLSIETRREVGESFSALGGLYKMFELQYIFGSEEDLIGVRTRVRDEPVHLYRLQTKPEFAKRLFEESVVAQNRLNEHPRFYNVVTANCTTSIRAQTPANERKPFDWRILVNGKLDQCIYENGWMKADGLTFEELHDRSLINAVANEGDSVAGFSERVRVGRPGFE